MKKRKNSSKYDLKREQIIQAAAEIINNVGASGMKMRDVASSVNLTSTTLVYYFKSRDNLAETVFDRRIAKFDQIVSEATAHPAIEDGIEYLLNYELDRIARSLRGEDPVLANLPSSNEIARFPAIEVKILGVFRKIDAYFLDSVQAELAPLALARSQMFTGLLFFLTSWVRRFPLDEHPRIRERILGIVRGGLAPAGSNWHPDILDIDRAQTDGEGSIGKFDFLRAATRLMNSSGYLGTSVDQIAEELNVTKGSFYYHLTSKDELVQECVHANFDRLARAVTSARAAGGTALQQLSSALATVFNLQLEQEWPLLRSTALVSVPPAIWQQIDDESRGVALRFAGLVADGIIEGSIRPVDPLIAGHVINTTLHTAFRLQEWAATMPRDRAISLLVSTLMRGLIDRQPFDS